MVGVRPGTVRKLVYGVICLGLATATARGDAESDHFNFAQGLFVQRDYRSAMEEYEGFLRGYPKSERVGEARYRLAECLFRLKMHKEAVTAYKAALAQKLGTGQSALAWYNLGRAHVALKQAEPAAAAFRQAMKQGEGTVREEATVGAGEQLVELKRYREACTILRGFLEAYPGSARRPDVLSSLAWVESTLGEHRRAADTCRLLLKECPDSKHATRARLTLSDSLTALKEYEAAAAVLAELQAEPAAAKDVALRQAWNSFKRGRRDDAAERFLAYAKQYPDDPAANSALYNAGVAHFESEDYEPAARVFAQLLERETTASSKNEARYWLGMSRHHLGKHAEALTVLQPLARQTDAMDSSRRSRLLFAIGQSLAATKQHEAAIGFFERLVKSAPDSELAARARYAKALEQETLKDLDGAVVSLEQLLKQKIPDALAHDARFALAEYLYRLGRQAAAKPHLEQLRKGAKQPAPRLLYRFAWTCYDMEQYEEAAAAFSELGTVESGYRREALYMLGRCCENRSDNKGAIAAYARLAAEQGADPYIEKALYRLGALQQDAEAAASLSRYRQRFPKGEHLLPLALRVAEQALARGDTRDASERFLALADRELPKELEGDVLYGLAWCRLKEDKLREADILFTRVAAGAAAEPKKQDALRQRGEIAYREQKYRDAARLFEQAEEDGLAADRRERLLYMRAWAARQTGDMTTARARFKRLLQQFPSGLYATDGAIRLAEALRDGGRLTEADAVLGNARRKGARPKYEEELFHLHAGIQVSLKNWRQVIETCEEILRKHPDSKQAYLAHFRAGLAQKALGLQEKARASFEATIRNTDTIEAAKAQFNLAALLYEQKKYLDAARGFLRVDLIYDYPDVAPKALFHAVRAFNEAGEPDRADRYRKQLQERFPQSEWAKKEGSQ